VLVNRPPSPALPPFHRGRVTSPQSPLPCGAGEGQGGGLLPFALKKHTLVRGKEETTMEASDIQLLLSWLEEISKQLTELQQRVTRCEQHLGLSLSL
jgi:hypothetical protein